MIKLHTSANGKSYSVPDEDHTVVVEMMSYMDAMNITETIGSEDIRRRRMVVFQNKDSGDSDSQLITLLNLLIYLGVYHVTWGDVKANSVHFLNTKEEVVVKMYRLDDRKYAYERVTIHTK